MYIVGITGASGSIIGVRLIEELIKSGKTVAAIVSDAGWKTLGHELFFGQSAPSGMAEVLERRNVPPAPGILREYANDDFFAPPASGTASFDALIIAPLSMKSLSAIAHGYADSLITRAADVALKEGRTCILMPRETPLGLAHIENMLAAKRAGAHIVPPVPGFYTHPRTIDDTGNFIVGKVLNLLGVEHELFQAWGKS
jgi:4-hydroxy-3-polyprenylbenzoate decarboxylase